MPSTDSRPLVVHVITGLGRGGAEKSLADLVRHARNFRHEVVSLTDEGYWAQPLRNLGIPVHVLEIKGTSTVPGGLFRLWTLLRRASPALIQTWLYHADFLGLAVASLCRVPVVWSLRCSDMDSRRYYWLTSVLSRLSHLPVAIAANSEAGRLWHSRLGYRPRRWDVISNGVDTRLFRPDPDARAAWRARMGVDDKTVLVGMAARKDPMKDHEAFLHSASLLANRRKGMAFCIAGRGTDKDAALRELADGNGDNVHWLGECNDMPGLLAALDVFVLASRFGEGFPNVVAEAMACGVPCVATNAGDCALLVGETGVIVPPGDAESMATAIERLADDARRRRQMGTAARARVEQNFTIASVVRGYETLWRAAIPGC